MIKTLDKEESIFEEPSKEERICCPDPTCRHPYTAGYLAPGSRLRCKCSRCKRFFWIVAPTSGGAAQVEENIADSRKTAEPGRTADNPEQGVSSHDNPGKHLR